MSRTAVTFCVLGFMFLGAESLAAKNPMTFKLEMGGVPPAVFEGCEQVGSENAIVEFREGTESVIVHKIPGNLEVLNLICRRTVNSDRSLWIWRKLVEDGLIADARKNGTLTISNDGSPIARYTLTNAWPAKLEVHSNADLIAIEELTLAVEMIDRTQ